MAALHPETIVVNAGRPTTAGRPLNVPIIGASSFISGAGPEYSRGDGTEGVRAFEQAIGELEGGSAVAFGSGMGAISAVFDSVNAGATILAPNDLYQGVVQVLDDGAKRVGWQIHRLPTEDTESWIEHIPTADFVWLESPSNPLLAVADIPRLCAVASSAGIPVAVDNTFATPLGQQPLRHGASYSVHSATKFIGGHSDLLAGVVVATSEQAAEPVRERRVYGGATIGALEAYLALRGLRTLSLRLDRSQANALELARRLSNHRHVTVVRYPGLPSHPSYEIAARTLNGPGAMLSFDVADTADDADRFIASLRIIKPATSLGGVETTIERRSKLRGQGHLPAGLVRLSVGIEHVNDLWADLDSALNER